jgi:hypothetical protein
MIHPAIPLFGPTSITNRPDFQRLRAATVQRIKGPVTVQRFKPQTSVRNGVSRRKVSFAEAQERCQLLAHKERLRSLAERRKSSGTTRQISAAEAENRLQTLIRSAAAECFTAAIGLRTEIARRPLSWG